MKPTQEQVIAWAREAGLIAPTAILSEGRTYDRAVNLAYTLAYEAGRKDENEACAVIAFNAKTYLEAAAAIRARREQ